MSKPISYQQSTVVNRSADEVWTYVADYTFGDQPDDERPGQIFGFHPAADP